MCSHRCPPIASGEPQPPDAGSYDISYMGGSPGTATELPTTPFLEAAELDNHQHEGSNLLYNTGGMQGGYLNHEDPMSLKQTDMTMLPLGLSNHQTFGSVPSLASSHMSSSVSSLSAKILPDLPVGSYGEFRKGSEPSVNTLSPFQRSWTGTDEMGMEQHGASQDDRFSLVMTNPTQASFASAGGSHSSSSVFQRDSSVEHASMPHYDGVPTPDAGSTAPLSMQSPTAFDLPQSRSLRSIQPGVYERDPEDGWFHRVLDGSERSNADIANRSTIGMSLWQLSSQAGQSGGQQQPKTYDEQCTCIQCGETFHGKYVDLFSAGFQTPTDHAFRYCKANMMRHVRAIHYGTAKTQCGICRAWFNRSDAVLKHAREKHGLQPANPKRRANS